MTYSLFFFTSKWDQWRNYRHALREIARWARHTYESYWQHPHNVKVRSWLWPLSRLRREGVGIGTGIWYLLHAGQHLFSGPCLGAEDTQRKTSPSSKAGKWETGKLAEEIPTEHFSAYLWRTLDIRRKLSVLASLCYETKLSRLSEGWHFLDEKSPQQRIVFEWKWRPETTRLCFENSRCQQLPQRGTGTRGGRPGVKEGLTWALKSRPYIPQSQC